MSAISWSLLAGGMEIAAAGEGGIFEDVQDLLERGPLRSLIWIRITLVGPSRELTANGELEYPHLVSGQVACSGRQGSLSLLASW